MFSDERTRTVLLLLSKALEDAGIPTNGSLGTTLCRTNARKSVTVVKLLPLWELLVAANTPIRFIGIHFADSLSEREDSFKETWLKTDLADLDKDELCELARIVSG